MSAVDDVLQKLKKQGKRAFMPFVTAGDPDLGFTKQIIKELAARGATMCEVGIPYSDPIADGPVIQASYTRALDNKVKLAGIFDMVREVTSETSMPLVSMVSYAIVFRHGLEKYVQDAKSAGFSGAIVPDLLIDEAEKFSAICQKHDFNLIQLVTPTTPRDRAIRIAKSSTGFLYYVSITGITGAASAVATDVGPEVERIKQSTDLPVCVGFGVKTPENAASIGKVADGVVVGSAIVDQIGAGKSPGDVLEFVAALAEGAHSARN